MIISFSSCQADADGKKNVCGHGWPEAKPQNRDRVCFQVCRTFKNTSIDPCNTVGGSYEALEESEGPITKRTKPETLVMHYFLQTAWILVNLAKGS